LDERTQRLALNESLFRELNERVEDQADAADASVIEVYCECANLDCIERIAMTETEYQAVRSDPAQFVVRAGHEALDIEEIVGGNDRFQIVRKRGESAAIATLLPPEGK
jgi:hypothetical protein